MLTADSRRSNTQTEGKQDEKVAGVLFWGADRCLFQDRSIWRQKGLSILDVHSTKKVLFRAQARPLSSHTISLGRSPGEYIVLVAILTTLKEAQTLAEVLHALLHTDPVTGELT